MLSAVSLTVVVTRLMMKQLASIMPDMVHGADLDGVGHEVAGHVTDLLTDIVLPVSVTNGVQLAHALCGLGLLIQLLHLGCVLLPTVQPEPMYLQHIAHSRVKKQLLASATRDLALHTVAQKPRLWSKPDRHKHIVVVLL